MNDKKSSCPRPADQTGSTRRGFLAGTAAATAAATALARVKLPPVHAAEDNTIRLALIGSGNRGCGAVRDAFSVPDAGPIQLYVIADLFEHRVKRAHKILSEKYSDRVNVPPDRQFAGFDAYKKAIDTLRPGSGDVAMLTGYAAWRPLQLEYAVQRGVNVFMEKSFATDPPGVRRVIAAGYKAKGRNLKIAAGLMCRHSVNRQELIKRIRAGELGDILFIRAYRMEPVGPLGPKPPKEKELSWQIRNFVRFFWVSGGLFAEMDIHQFDEICWLKDAWPIQAHGVGGRAADSTDRSQNLDSYFAELTFADGTKAIDVVRYLPNCYTDFVTYVHGTKRAAQFSGWIHKGDVRIFRDQRIDKDNILWEAPPEKYTLWVAEWIELIKSIRTDREHNEAERAAKSNLAAIMARATVHSGQVITWEDAFASNFRFCSYTDTMSEDSSPPLKPDDDGYYPVPVPGKWKEI